MWRGNNTTRSRGTHYLTVSWGQALLLSLWVSLCSKEGLVSGIWRLCEPVVLLRATHTWGPELGPCSGISHFPQP